MFTLLRRIKRGQSEENQDEGGVETSSCSARAVILCNYVSSDESKSAIDNENDQTLLDKNGTYDKIYFDESQDTKSQEMESLTHMTQTIVCKDGENEESFASSSRHQPYETVSDTTLSDDSTRNMIIEFEEKHCSNRDEATNIGYIVLAQGKWTLRDFDKDRNEETDSKSNFTEGAVADDSLSVSDDEDYCWIPFVSPNDAYQTFSDPNLSDEEVRGLIIEIDKVLSDPTEPSNIGSIVLARGKW
jgi:hypothetical protein